MSQRAPMRAVLEAHAGQVRAVTLVEGAVAPPLAPGLRPLDRGLSLSVAFHDSRPDRPDRTGTSVPRPGRTAETDIRARQNGQIMPGASAATVPQSRALNSLG